MKKCNHLFKMVFPLTDMRNQLCECMNCGKKEKRELIPGSIGGINE